MTDFIYSATTSSRLDKALAHGPLGLGLRARQQLISQGLVLIDGRPGRKGDLVLPGQRITVLEKPMHAPAPVTKGAPLPQILAQTSSYAALAKPGGMHSVAGKGQHCLEALLPVLGLSGWALMNRLDYLTSGLVLVARTLHDVATYKQWQDSGMVHKYYLALAHGSISASFWCRGRILDDRRRVVRVLNEEDQALRATHVEPLFSLEGRTVILVRIFKGRRHQIRAHLAHAGHALVGDPVYGQGEDGGLYLHHAMVKMPDFLAWTLPDWPMSLDAVADVLQERIAAAPES